MSQILRRTAADFFAGIGLVGLGLQRQGWTIEYAVDYSDEKREMYEHHFGKGHYRCEDITTVSGSDVPRVTLAHASFPCTDLSVAGGRAGINNGESSSFWSFVRILHEMDGENGPERPPLVLVENVEGMLTSHGGEDIEAALTALCDLGYAVDILLINAAQFVPQSRVRLFIIGVLSETEQDLFSQARALDSSDARPEKIKAFIRKHPQICWNLRDLPFLPHWTTNLEDIVDQDAEWWPGDRADYLFNQMYDRHKDWVRRMMLNNYWSYGTVFRRMRMRDGRKQSTAELRTDGIAGCLRTPKGGSARQILVRAGNGRYDARLLNGRECALLMGADDYSIDENLSLNQVLFGFGDAVCVPVIEWITEHYLNPAIEDLALQATHN